ncbi:MAG TPA: anthranilate synthase component I family protein [Polyangiaceae bacterium]|nr:anthranilate synthase component I family protein [Polyangiaceae bacterium]
MLKKTLVVDGLTPVGAYQALRSRSEGGSFLLESVVPGERWGRFSILGYRPRSHIVLYGEPGRDPFARLAELFPTGEPDDEDVATRFARAAVGMIPYDIVHYATKVPAWPDSAREPIARLLRDFTAVVFDNLTHTAVIAAHDASDIERAERDLASAPPLDLVAPPDPSAAPPDVDVTMSDEAYGAAVERAKEYIRAGDAFQIVPARTFSTPARGADPFDVYRALRVLSPAPYMYLLEMPAAEGAGPVAIAGASPETLVRVERGRITLRPIAGTKPRGRSREEDEKLAQEMLADPKERAEHVMLIDLARNDVGRVSRAGTVVVPERMFIERYSHVMHITSEVQGELRPGVGPWDVMRATFPAGTLTGAPKVRAMQIIRELETRRRGAYGGAIGYITCGQDLDLAIAIRTVVLAGDRFEVTAGAGIVADSVPALEAQETRNKARAALAAIHAARSHRRRG